MTTKKATSATKKATSATKKATSATAAAIEDVAGVETIEVMKAEETAAAIEDVAGVETIEVMKAEETAAAALPVAKVTGKSGKVTSKEVLKAAGSLRAAVKEERRGANCTIRLIVERAAAGDAAAVDILCALCDVPRAAIYSLDIDTIRAAVNAWYPYHALIIEMDQRTCEIINQRKVSVKPVGVWYTTKKENEEIEDAAKRVQRGYRAAVVSDYLDQLIKAAKCRAKGVQPRRVDAEAIYNDITLSEFAVGITCKGVDDAKARKSYLSGAVNVWRKHSLLGFYI